jgi:4-amino-4-deoxy-L-arabinose transferase-like glycosyltransferase
VTAVAPGRPARRRLDAAVALVLAALTVSWLLAVEGNQGISRDEAQYFRAAEHYWGWFESLATNAKRGKLGQSFSRAGIEAYWSDNPEHPVVMKTLYALSWRLFHRCECVKEAAYHFSPVTGKHMTIPLFARESTAFRFPAILMAGLGVALVYLFARRWIGRTAAAAAAVLFIAQPHLFFHAQIAAFDAPITVMAIVLGYAYWRSLRSPKWGILAGVAFGVALGVKHNAWLMPFFLGLHYLWMRRRDLLRLRLRVPLAFVAMVVLGPLVFFLHWPKLWENPVGHTRWYVNRHLQHEHYNFEYLGRNWNLPPTDWDLRLLRMTFPFVSTGLTVPVTTLALAGVGAALLVRRSRRRGQDDDTLLPEAPPEPTGSWLRPGADVDLAPGAFLLVQILGPMAILALPSTPIFGGVKHFMPAMPYLAIVAGIGLRWAARRIAGWIGEVLPDPRVARVVPAALATLVCLPAVAETQRSHPDGLSHYNLLAGGFAGGASLGMNRQFWGYSVMPMLDWITNNVPPSRATYWHDVFPDALTMYIRDGRIPPGLGNVGVGEDVVKRSDLGIVIHERHFAVYEGLLWEAYGTTKPAYVRTREGVPLVTAYRRPAPPPPIP